LDLGPTNSFSSLSEPESDRLLGGQDHRSVVVARRPDGRAVTGAWPGLRWLLAWLLLFGCAVAHAQPKPESAAASHEDRARASWQAGYLFHQLGNYERAIEFYRESIAAHPTAEAHTFLGWSLSHQGKLEDAIAECRIAIQIDPDFGNPYNDIGVYLIDLGRAREAIEWLNKAAVAKRYCCYQFPHFNLGRVLLLEGKSEEARLSFERALKYDPQYLPALMGLEYIRQQGLKGL
jgi:Tfp pilus assembly protein PilF